MCVLNFYSPACACSTDHIEVVAGLWRRLRIDGFHELLQDHQGGQAAYAAAIEREQAYVAARHLV
jgi:hypothetical protein